MKLPFPLPDKIKGFPNEPMINAGYLDWERVKDDGPVSRFERISLDTSTGNWYASVRTVQDYRDVYTNEFCPAGDTTAIKIHQMLAWLEAYAWAGESLPVNPEKTTNENKFSMDIEKLKHARTSINNASEVIRACVEYDDHADRSQALLDLFLMDIEFNRLIHKDKCAITKLTGEQGFEMDVSDYTVTWSREDPDGYHSEVIWAEPDNGKLWVEVNYTDDDGDLSTLSEFKPNPDADLNIRFEAMVRWLESQKARRGRDILESWNLDFERLLNSLRFVYQGGQSDDLCHVWEYYPDSWHVVRVDISLSKGVAEVSTSYVDEQGVEHILSSVQHTISLSTEAISDKLTEIINQEWPVRYAVPVQAGKDVEPESEVATSPGDTPVEYEPPVIPFQATLLDTFACHALPLANRGGDFEDTAKRAFLLADAMLKERSAYFR